MSNVQVLIDREHAAEERLRMKVLDDSPANPMVASAAECEV